MSKGPCIHGMSLAAPTILARARSWDLHASLRLHSHVTACIKAAAAVCNVANSNLALLTPKDGATALSSPKVTVKRAVAKKPSLRPLESPRLPQAYAPLRVPTNTTLVIRLSCDGCSPHSHRPYRQKSRSETIRKTRCALHCTRDAWAHHRIAEVTIGLGLM